MPGGQKEGSVEEQEVQAGGNKRRRSGFRGRGTGEAPSGRGPAVEVVIEHFTPRVTLAPAGLQPGRSSFTNLCKQIFFSSLPKLSRRNFILETLPRWLGRRSCTTYRRGRCLIFFRAPWAPYVRLKDALHHGHIRQSQTRLAAIARAPGGRGASGDCRGRQSLGRLQKPDSWSERRYRPSATRGEQLEN